jgi:hypothetical protein
MMKVLYLFLEVLSQNFNIISKTLQKQPMI